MVAAAVSAPPAMGAPRPTLIRKTTEGRLRTVATACAIRASSASMRAASFSASAATPRMAPTVRSFAPMPATLGSFGTISTGTPDVRSWSRTAGGPLPSIANTRSGRKARIGSADRRRM
jgi:hypothetical protein